MARRSSRIGYASDDKEIIADFALPNATGTRTFFFGGVDQFGGEIAGLSLRPANTGAMGARPDQDGVNAGSFWWVGIGNAVDVEHEEAVFPFLADYCNLAPDQAGAGKLRGGSGMSYGVLIHHSPSFFVQTFGLGSRYPANPGIFGGYHANVRPGFRMSAAEQEKLLGAATPRDELELLEIADANGADVEMRAQVEVGSVLEHGDFVGVVNPGAGGYGDILEREPESVVGDLRQRIISRWSAENVYRVIVDEAGNLDAGATAAARDAERSRRLAEAKPFDEFVADWDTKRPPEAALIVYGNWPDPSADGRI